MEEAITETRRTADEKTTVWYPSRKKRRSRWRRRVKEMC